MEFKKQQEIARLIWPEFDLWDVSYQSDLTESVKRIAAGKPAGSPNEHKAAAFFEEHPEILNPPVEEKKEETETNSSDNLSGETDNAPEDETAGKKKK